MSAHTCHECRHPIPSGMAVKRSRAFQLVTLCRECGPDRVERRWALRHEGTFSV